MICPIIFCISGSDPDQLREIQKKVEGRISNIEYRITNNEVKRAGKSEIGLKDQRLKRSALKGFYFKWF